MPSDAPPASKPAMSDSSGPLPSIQRSLDIMAALRDPDTGCPWDIEQDFSSIAPYTIEEAYEVADAISRGDMSALRDELGDLLFQVIFHAQMAAEAGLFDIADVAEGLNCKMERRHPHVFGDSRIEDADAQTRAWEQMKARERAGRGQSGLLDDIPKGMAELQRAVKLQKRAGRVGFDWASPGPVLEKFDEELDEMREAMTSGDTDQMEDELGDLLFVACNLARQLRIDPGRALRRANLKFETRFRAMENRVGGPEALNGMNLEDQEALWQAVKSDE